MPKKPKSSNPNPAGATRASRWTYYLMPEYDDIEEQKAEAIEFFEAITEAQELLREEYEGTR